MATFVDSNGQSFPVVNIFRSISLLNTGALVKPAPGRITFYYVYNNATSVRFLKFYDQSTTPASTDTPVLTLPIPPTSGANLAVQDFPTFKVGIGVRATTLVADSDNTAPSANDVVLNIGYV